MPWLISGVFERISPPYTGSTVWEQNRQGGYKIVSSRHDTHDQDMAIGITQSLNVEGYNQMLANMNMGGFRITNLLAGIGDTDAVNLAQLDAVEAQVIDNTSDIAAIKTSDPDSIITAVNWDFTNLTHVRTNGNYVVELKRFDQFKAGQIIRHNGVDLTWAAVTEVDTQVANRWYLYNNTPGTFDLNFIYPTGADPDLPDGGENYFTEGMIIIENGGTPSLPTIQAGGIDVSPSSIIGSPTLNAGTRYTLSYSIQRTLGDVYRVAYIWSAP
jgi:hypothetical protein